MKKNLILFLMLFFYIDISARVLIFTYAYNQPKFIGLQHNTFEKFLKDEYEFIVFSDAKTNDMHNKIQLACDECNIKCIRIPQEIHDQPYLSRPKTGYFSQHHAPAVRNCNVIQYSLDILGFDHDDILMIIDSDAFLIKDFSIRDYLGEALLGGPKKLCSAWPRHDCKQLHPHIAPFNYIWPGLMMFNMKKLPNKRSILINCGYVYDTIPLDAGGTFHYYLRDNPTILVKYCDQTNFGHLVCDKCKKKQRPVSPCMHNRTILINYGLNELAINIAQKMPLPSEKQGKDIQFLMNGTFIHYCEGGNYHNFPQSFENIKTTLLNSLLTNLLK